jgi:hypothetical protein
MSGFKKRTESSLVTALGNYLQVLENMGKIAFWSRQQAGKVCIPGKNKLYKMRLGREGISDLWVMPVRWNQFTTREPQWESTVPMIWIEAKLDGEKQSPDQVEFEKLANKCGHYYWVIHDCDELEKKLKEIGVL